MIRFSAVGGLATALHFTIALSLLWLLSASAQGANMIAFLCALTFSFLCHRRFTFRSRKTALSSGPRFLLTAGIAYLCSALALRALQEWTELPAEAQLFLAAGIIPVVTYLSGRFWVF